MLIIITLAYGAFIVVLVLMLETWYLADPHKIALVFFCLFCFLLFD